MAETVNAPDLVLSHLDSLPALPAIAIELLEIDGEGETALRDVLEYLHSDQSLASHAISVANATVAGARGRVATLEQAAALLGFARVRSMVLSTSMFHWVRKPAPDSNTACGYRTKLWKHALAVACGARQLAQIRTEVGLQPEDAYIAGLLHDIGKVALDAVFPKAYARIAGQADRARGDIADYERAILGVDHTVAGRRLAERWRLPRALQEVIWLHHLAADALPSSVGHGPLIGLVQLADTLAREQDIGYSGNHVFYEPAPQLAERLGFTPQHIAAVVPSLGSEVAEHATGLGLDGETTAGEYAQRTTRESADRGQLHDELLATNRRLAAAARYFRALSQLERDLTDWSDPAAVVAALAGAAAVALQRPRVAVFGLRDHAVGVDVSWVGRQSDERGHFSQVVPDDLAAWLGEAHGPSDTFIVHAPPPVRTLLLPALTPADDGMPWLLPVRHGDKLVGGIVYLSDTDERARLADELDDLRSFLTSAGLTLGRANAQAAARRLSEDLAETNRRLQQVQAELLRSRTLSIIAEMAAGAGHELNGPLTVISGRAQMLAATLKDPEAQRVLKTISEKAHECSGIVTELMDFAHPRPPQLGRVDLAALLADVQTEWLERCGLPPSRLRFEPEPMWPDRTRSAAPPWGTLRTETQPASASGTGDRSCRGEPALVALADRQQIKTVLGELLSNAVDAVSANEGAIVLRCHAAPQTELLEVLVEDTGCGMTPAVLQRAFDPFSSHRTAGRGRGLGLPRASRIVEAHGGRIWLDSRPDEGTTAHVLLPRAPGQ